LHPASRIVIYLLAALAIPGLPFFMLAIPLLAALPLLAGWRRSPARLIWRTRWLLLVLVVGYAYGLPGESLLPALGAWSPSHEGALHGTQQALRLLALLLWLDILVLRLSSEDLLAGLYLLMHPLTRLGIDRQRATLRLGLTLRAIEGLERGKGNLRRMLEQNAGLDLPETVQLPDYAFRPMDVLVPFVMLLGILGLWLNA
jgi:energy-coupling factor transporter transmembrane protein EcfT